MILITISVILIKTLILTTPIIVTLTISLSWILILLVLAITLVIALIIIVTACDDSRDLVPFIQLKIREKQPWRSDSSGKVVRFSLQLY